MAQKGKLRQGGDDVCGVYVDTVRKSPSLRTEICRSITVVINRGFIAWCWAAVREAGLPSVFWPGGQKGGLEM